MTANTILNVIYFYVKICAFHQLELNFFTGQEHCEHSPVLVPLATVHY